MARQRLRAGFGAGIVATVAMSIPMLAATATGLSPMPEPIPKAVVTQLLGSTVPEPVAMALAIGLHLGYGGLFGAAFARIVTPATVGSGLGFGVALWALSQVTVLPFVGWGVLGTAVAPAIAIATLGLHLLYGGVVGWTLAGDGRPLTDRPTATAD